MSLEPRVDKNASYAQAVWERQVDRLDTTDQTDTQTHTHRERERERERLRGLRAERERVKQIEFIAKSDSDCRLINRAKSDGQES